MARAATPSMSQHKFQHLLVAAGLALASIGVSAPPAAALASAPDLGDSVRPRAMKAAAAADLLGPARTPLVSAQPAAVTGPQVASHPQVRRHVFGYVNAGNLTDASVGYTTWHLADLTEVAYFGIHVNSDGSLASATNDSGRRQWDDSTIQPAFLSAMHNAGVKVILSIIQQNQGTLCASLAAAQTTVTQTIGELRGADGVNIDYEGSQANCTSTAGDTMSARLTNLARLFRQQLPAGHNNLSIATYASSAEFTGGFFDISGLAAYVDSFFVMAYDLDNSNYQHTPLSCSRYCLNPVGPAYGQPDAASGYWYNDTRAAETYTSRLGSGAKVILGVPYYGWVACVQGTAGKQSAGRPGAHAYPDSTSPQWSNPGYLDAQSNISQPADWITQLQVSSDPTNTAQNGEPYATWWSPPAPAGAAHPEYYHNCWREMYWDDTSALGHKYDVVNKYNLLGAGLFALDYGGGASELWYDISSHFNCPSTATSGLAWQQLPGQAIDMAPGPNCTGYAVGVDSKPGGHGIYFWNGSSWAWTGGGGVRVSDGPNGPWAVNANRQIYVLTQGWHQVGGQAQDVGVGSDGTVWVIGSNATPGGYGLWRWDSGHWSSPFGGGGVRVAVDSSGQPWIVNAVHQIWRHTDAGWKQVPGSATDVGAGGNGAVWIVGTDAGSGGYHIWRWLGSGWGQIGGSGVAVGVDAAGMPWIANSANVPYERV